MTLCASPSRTAVPSIFLLLLVLFGSGFGVVPARAGEEIEILGKALGPDGLPVPEARVFLLPSLSPFQEGVLRLADARPEPAVEGKTGKGGEFLLNAPSAGNWTVRLEAAGFVPAEYRLLPLVEPAVLPPVRLEIDLGIQVKVTGEEGKPLPGAQVQLARRTDRFAEFLDNDRWETPDRSGITGEDGTIRLPRAGDKRQDLAAFAPGYAPFVRPAGGGTAATIRLHPAASRTVQVVETPAEGTERKPVPVAGALLLHKATGLPLGRTGPDGRGKVPGGTGGRSPLQVVTEDGRSVSGGGGTLVLPPLETMVGQVIDLADRSPLEGAVVRLEGEPWRAVRTDRAGGFLLQAARGTSGRILADGTGYLASRDYSYRFDGEGRPGPIIPLTAAASLQGTVVDAGGRGIPNARISLSVRQAATGMMRVEIGESRPPRAVSDDQGRFRVMKIDPSDQYDLSASAEGYVTGKTPVLDLEPHRTRRGVKVTLQEGRELTGRVLDSKEQPIADARVEMKPAPNRRMGGMMILGGDAPGAAETFSDQEGRFSLTGLPSGPSTLSLSRKGYARLQVDGLEIQEGGGKQDLGEFRMEPGARVQGLIVDSDGLPVADAEVRASSPGAGPKMMFLGIGGEPPKDEPDAVSDLNGWFSVEDLPTGRKTTLTVSRKGFLKASVPVDRVPNLEPLTITLDPSSEIQGIILDPDGEPVPGADVNLARTVKAGAGNMAIAMMMVEGAVTDNEGRFHYEGLEPGKISISASAPGFRETKEEGIEVVKGEDIDDFRLVLEAGAVLAGQVRTPGGKPAVNAVVSIVRNNSSPDFDGGGGTASTDGGGNYRLDGLPAGPVSIEATHDSYVRTVKDLELDLGVNSLDLQFEGGREVAGTVIGPDGSPVPGASVRMSGADRFRGGPGTESDGAGRFRLEGVADGDYTLTAGAEGFAPSEPVPVTVAGDPVAGVEIRLQAAGTITGRVLGLDPEDYPQVDVTAIGGPGRFGDSRVDREGRFRIEGIGPGEYTLRGTVGRTGNQAEGRAVLEEGALETTADLEFGGGVTLTGRVLLGDRPFAGATVSAVGTDVSHSGWGETGDDGQFRLSGLKPGTYEVKARQWRTGISHQEEVEITSNRDVELIIPTTRVSGTVVDAGDRQPLSGVRVSLALPGESRDSFFQDRTAITDKNGRFTIGNVADGSWTLWGVKNGYAAASQELAVTLGNDLENLRIELEPTEGLSLLVQYASGRVPATVRAAVLDPAGTVIVSGGYSTGENGSLRLSSVPPGKWNLLLYATGAGVLSTWVDAPGGPTPVALPPACLLKVTVPDLAERDERAVLTLLDGEGRPFRSMEWFGEPVAEWTLSGGSWNSRTLPPGRWTVQVQAADGRTWRGSAVTDPGKPSELTLSEH